MIDEKFWKNLAASWYLEAKKPENAADEEKPFDDVSDEEVGDILAELGLREI